EGSRRVARLLRAARGLGHRRKPGAGLGRRDSGHRERRAVPGWQDRNLDRRVAIMTNVGNPAAMLELREVQAAARTLGLEVAALEIRRAEDIARAFEEVKGRAEALYVCIDALLFFHRILINTLALAARLPTMLGNREHVATGGLAHYG